MNCFPKVCLQSFVVVMATACFGLTTAQATPLTVEFTPTALFPNPSEGTSSELENGESYSQTVGGVGVTLTPSNLIIPGSYFDDDGIGVSGGESYAVQFSQAVTVTGFTVGYADGAGFYDFMVNDDEATAFSLFSNSARFITIGSSDTGEGAIALQPTDLFRISGSFGGEGGVGQVKSLSFTATPVPEPTFHAAGAIGMACVGLLLRRRKRLAARG